MTTQQRQQEVYRRAVSLVHDQAPMLRLAREIHRTDRGLPILFADKPYLIALYAAIPKLRRAVFRKAVQTGISEALIQLMLYRAGWLGHKTAYALPTDKVASRFVKERIDPLIESVPTYRALLPFGQVESRKADMGNITSKRFGRGMMRFLGAATKANWVEFSTDLLIVDEHDLCEPEHVAMAPDRVKASREPSLIYVGNPTDSGVGIDQRYQEGSRGKWFQRCSRCGHRQVLDWFVHFVEQTDAGLWVPRDQSRHEHPADGDLRPVCARCVRPWDRTSGGGCWVHERSIQDDVAASFTMSHLDMLARSRDERPMRAMLHEWVAAQTDDAALVKFFQSKLGQAKRAQGASLTVELLRRAATGRPMDPMGESTRGKLLVLSSDVGSTFHVTVRELHEDMSVQVGYRSETRWVGTTRSWAGLTAIHERFNPGISVVDAGPEGTAAREWCAAVERRLEGCQAYRCAFHRTAHVAGRELAFTKSVRDRLVTVDRTQAMDRAFYDLRDGFHALPADVFTVPNWSEQMCAPVRQVRDDGTAFWSKGDDHYRLSDTYARVGVQIAAGSGCLPSPERS